MAHRFRRLQLVSATAYSLGHRTNAQKTMGTITALLVMAGYLRPLTIPIWVILAAHVAIALGTLTGGRQIVHMMGSKITKPQPSPCRGGQHENPRQRDTHDHRRDCRRQRDQTATRRAMERRAADRVSVCVTIPGSAIIAVTYHTLAVFGYR